ncbi:hypothetical protein [Pseudomonas putida]|uniref:GAP1-N1 domain-containing protein n=1 Tax=Pseudomonas putida TaxID=303 RepID=UPI0002E3E0B4|nr:hypothetical protein [Pseudomonas putida]
MKFDQCLFGYEDGHRLLASSIPLGAETSLLTELSDLAPGTVFNRSNGYWTGLPVPSLGCYVLMRTWPAPEMSRPGCVWTHALLIPPALFESLDDLSALRSFAVRPSGLADKERYREGLNLDLLELKGDSAPFDSVVINQILLSLYDASATKSVEIELPGQLDAPLFAVWSQQWPRLRRNLRFRTSVSRGPGALRTTRFDVTAELGPTSVALLSDSWQSTSWLVAASADVAEGPKGILRSFLWLYGKDVKRQRGSFLPLTRINLIAQENDRNAATELIELVTQSFPTPHDAQRLKQDLVDGVLVPATQPRILEWLLSEEGKRAVFPAPNATSLDRLRELWPERSNEMLPLLEAAISTDDSLGELLVNCLLDSPNDALIWLIKMGSSKLQMRLIQAKPHLLLESWVLDIGPSSLARLVTLVHDQISGFENMIPHFLVRDDLLLIDVFFKFFPVETARQILLSMKREGHEAATVWWHALRRSPEVLLQPDVIGCISYGSQLYAIAEILDWRVPHDAAHIAQLWNVALTSVDNDLSVERIDKLHCLSIKIAIAAGGLGGMALVELTFNRIHDQLMNSRLEESAKELLWDVLADAGWLKAWDMALRFRLTIAGAYVKNQWPPLSYSSLAPTKKGRKMLAEAASEIQGGDAYTEAASL